MKLQGVLKDKKGGILPLLEGDIFMMYKDDYPKRIQFDKGRLMSNGTLSYAPRLGWVKLIDDNGNTYDSRAYGVLKATPRVQFSPKSGEVVQIPNRSEPLFTQNRMRSAKNISVTIGITDERIAEIVLHDFCRNGKLIISTHPNLYYKVQVMESAVSSGVSRRFSEITIPYTTSVYRYLLNEPLIKTGKLSENGVSISGSFEYSSEFPYSEEESEPNIYIITQSGAQADTLAVEISVDDGDVFRAENLSSDTVYCIDSELLSFYIYGKVESDGSVTKNEVFEDVTCKTIGDFPKTGSQKQHQVRYNGYINGLWIQPNARWNI